MTEAELDLPWKEMIKKWSAPDRSEPALFHYTGSDVLGILLQSQTVWATYAKHSNDSSEFEQLKLSRPVGSFDKGHPSNAPKIQPLLCKK